MKLVNVLKRFLNSIKAPASGWPIQASGSPDIALPRILAMVSQTREVELTCDEVHELLDQFAEMVERSEDVVESMPLVKYHLDLCADCREEFEALMRILEFMEQ